MAMEFTNPQPPTIMNELSRDAMSRLSGGSDLFPSLPSGGDVDAILQAALRGLSALFGTLPSNPWRLLD